MKKNAAYVTIDEYIQMCPKDVQERLNTIRQLIRRIAPEAQEKIAYQMPTFFLNGNIVHFAAHTKHIGFYPTPSGITRFKRELAKYVSSKGAVQFPMEESLPVELIKKIVRFRVEENLRKAKR